MMGKDEIDAELARRQAQLAGFESDLEQTRRDLAEIADRRRPLLLPASEGDEGAAEQLERETQRLTETRQKAEDLAELIEQTKTRIAELKAEAEALERAERLSRVRELIPERLHLAEQIAAAADRLVDVVRRHSAVSIAMSQELQAIGETDDANQVGVRAHLDRYLTTVLGALRQRPVRILQALPSVDHAHRVPLLDSERSILAKFINDDDAADKAA